MGWIFFNVVGITSFTENVFQNEPFGEKNFNQDEMKGNHKNDSL